MSRQREKESDTLSSSSQTPTVHAVQWNMSVACCSTKWEVSRFYYTHLSKVITQSREIPCSLPKVLEQYCSAEAAYRIWQCDKSIQPLADNYFFAYFRALGLTCVRIPETWRAKQQNTDRANIHSTLTYYWWITNLWNWCWNYCFSSIIFYQKDF